MKNKIAILGLAFAVLFVFGIGSASAETNIWTNIENEGGYSAYQQSTSIGGYDWSESSYQITGTINEGFENEGNIWMNKELHNKGQWLLEERTTLGGEGETEIFKHVDAWTEDNRVEDGKLKYPTELWVEYSFAGHDSPLYDADTFYALIDEPPAQDGEVYGNHAYYNKFLDTNEEFNFGEKVGIGDFPSDFEHIAPPTFEPLCWFNQVE